MLKKILTQLSNAGKRDFIQAGILTMIMLCAGVLGYVGRYSMRSSYIISRGPVVAAVANWPEVHSALSFGSKKSCVSLKNSDAYAPFALRIARDYPNADVHPVSGHITFVILASSMLSIMALLSIFWTLLSKNSLQYRQLLRTLFMIGSSTSYLKTVYNKHEINAFFRPMAISCVFLLFTGVLGYCLGFDFGMVTLVVIVAALSLCYLVNRLEMWRVRSSACL